jgi:site-specific recombinase XerD
MAFSSGRLGRTKTGSAEDDQRVVIVGRPVDMLQAWIARGGIAKGPVFRRIDRWGTLQERALTPQSVNLILKKRIAGAGLDAREFSAHGLRSGFMTEAARQGVERQMGPAARLIV